MGAHSLDPSTLDAAIAADDAAAEVKTPEANLMRWETLQLSKPDVLTTIGTSIRDRARIQQAYEVARKTKSVLTALGSPDAGMFDGMVTTKEQVLEMMAE